MDVKLLTDNAKAPTIATKNSAGYDLYTCTDEIIRRIHNNPIKLGIAIHIPEGYVGLIWPKSGLAKRFGLKILGGVIDSDYRGEIMVMVEHGNVAPIILKAGSKIAQLIIQPIYTAKCEIVDTLDDTDRGDGGFGSTGS